MGPLAGSIQNTPFTMRLATHNKQVKLIVFSLDVYSLHFCFLITVGSAPHLKLGLLNARWLPVSRARERQRMRVTEGAQQLELRSRPLEAQLIAQIINPARDLLSLWGGLWCGLWCGLPWLISRYTTASERKRT